jgi:hypothetical protein
MRNKLGNHVLTGDASFFRSAALIQSERERALKDLQSLASRRAWQEKERAVGGGRLVFVGDALLGAGRADDAAAVYQPLSSCAERTAVASAHAALQKGRSVGESLPTDGSGNCWAELLGAVARLKEGDPAAASEALRTPQAIFDLKGAALARDSASPPIRLPVEVSAALNLLHGQAEASVRAATWISDCGKRWIELCPVAPHWVAAAVLSTLCGEGKWHRALEFATELECTGQDWAKELAALTRIRRALARAISGDLGGAEIDLKDNAHGPVS